MRTLTFCLLSHVVLAATGHAVQLHQSAPTSEILVTLSPGSPLALVQEVRSIDYSGANQQTVAFSYGQARVVTGSIRINPPAGVTVQRSHRLAGRDDCVVWDLVGQAEQAAPTWITYELEGLKWQLLYRLDFHPAGRMAAQGTAALGARLEITNESGLDLRGAFVNIALGGETDGPQSLQVGGGPRSLPAGWTKQWPVGAISETRGIADDLPAAVRYVYAPHLYGRQVQKLLVMTESQDSVRGLWLMGLPEGPMEVFLDAAAERSDLIPTATCAWRSLTDPRLAEIVGRHRAIDLGPEPAISVDDRAMERRKENTTFDSQGRVVGIDVVEKRLITVTNRVGHDVTLSLCHELLSKWNLQVTEPVAEPARALADDRDQTQAVLWDGTLHREQTLVVRFTLVKPQGAGQ